MRIPRPLLSSALTQEVRTHGFASPRKCQAEFEAGQAGAARHAILAGTSADGGTRTPGPGLLLGALGGACG